MSTHSQDRTADEMTDVPADTGVEQVSTSAKEPTEKVDGSTEATDDTATSAVDPAKRIQWARMFAFGVLPAFALLLALGAGCLKYMDNSARVDDIAIAGSPIREAVQAAKDTTVALLSYKPGTVQQQLNAARDLLTGDFRDSYTSLINDVVIPGAEQKQISAVATVPASALVSADSRRAVVLVFVNQSMTIGQGASTDTASSVRVTMDKVGSRWLISSFDPV
jgi:Mce-associated membrane protein